MKNDKSAIKDALPQEIDFLYLPVLPVQRRGARAVITLEYSREVMAMSISSELKEFFEQRACQNLRSIIKYEEESFDVVYIQDDVVKRYNERELESAIADSRMESLTAPMYNEPFSDGHGDLTCIVQCFENVIEMNFVVTDGQGLQSLSTPKQWLKLTGLLPKPEKSSWLVVTSSSAEFLM